ncbi:hypothetical protein FACS1894158_06010 [Betaproteobacteria bacterium]|nr:hypothetical protein FACS1894158_06010 [Betaproteobacteria bacterium]
MSKFFASSFKKTARHGVLALKYTGKRLPLQVMHSTAGFYLGTENGKGPVSRESFEYYLSHEAAERALADETWTQRAHC